MPCEVSYAIVTIKPTMSEQSGIDAFTVTNYGVSDNLLMWRRHYTKASGEGEREKERKREREREREREKDPGA